MPLKYFIIVLLALASYSAFGSEITKTVGTSDASYDYPTIAVAFDAFNAGIITDSDGMPVDSVTFLLMDSVYNEPELILRPTAGTRTVRVYSGLSSDAHNVINISRVFGTGVGLTVDSVESFSMSDVDLYLDPGTIWSAAERIKLRQGVKMEVGGKVIAPTATIGFEVLGDSGGTFTMENSSVVAAKTGFFLDEIQVFASLTLKHNTFSSMSVDSSTAILLNGVCDSVIIESNTINLGSVARSRGIVITKPAGGTTARGRMTIAINEITVGYDGVAIQVEEARDSLMIHNNTINLGAATRARGIVTSKPAGGTTAKGRMTIAVNEITVGYDGVAIQIEETNDTILVDNNTIIFGSAARARGIITAKPGSTGGTTANGKISVSGNNITSSGGDSSIAISLDKVWCFAVKVEDNAINMGSTTKARGIIVGRPAGGTTTGGRMTIAINEITVGYDGVAIQIEEADDTILVDNNTMNFGSAARARGIITVKSSGSTGTTNGRMSLSGNTITSTGGDSCIAIQVEVVNDSLAIQSNTINLGNATEARGIITNKPNIGGATATGRMSVSGNVITSGGGNSSTAITLDEVLCLAVTVEDNIIDMGSMMNAKGIVVKKPDGGNGKISVSGNNVMNGGDSSIAIQVDDASDSTMIDNNNINIGFAARARGIIAARPGSPGPITTNGKISVSGNTITSSGGDSTIAISLEKKWCFAIRVADNAIDMGGSGTAIKTKGFGFIKSEDGSERIHSNTITNASMGVDILLDNDTTGFGGISPDSITFGSIEIFDNMMNNVRTGLQSNPAFVDHGQVGEMPSLQRMSISRNTITGSSDPINPGLTGIRLDSLSTRRLEIDSNTVSGYQTNLQYGWVTSEDVLASDVSLQRIRGNCFNNSTGDGASLNFSNRSTDTARVLIENNSFTNSGGNGLRVIVDTGIVHLYIAGNTFRDNSGDGLKVTEGSLSADGSSLSFELHFDRYEQGGYLIAPKVYTGEKANIFTAPSSLMVPNIFVNNIGMGITIGSGVDLPGGIHYQNFSNNGEYNFYNGTNHNIDATGCWWGMNDSAEIAGLIYDGNDSTGIGIVSFVPFLADSITSLITGIPVQYNRGWNLVSVPVKVVDYLKTSLYPNAVSDAFAFVGSYQLMQTLSHGVGYWLKFNTTQTITFSGFQVNSDTISVVAGWNMIGSIGTSVAVGTITSNPPGIQTSQFFGYNNGYGTTSTIEAGKGYWVKVSQAGTLILSSVVSNQSSVNSIKIVQTSEVPPPPPGFETANLKTETPNQFALEQNYPNPFNPSTVISYSLSVNGYVSLKVYNMLGVEIATLVDGMQEAGFKSIPFDASGLPSGVYTYRLFVVGQDGILSYTDVKKMVLMR
ncbi:MAG: T9SS type A sorting domain-containing protein [Bacteroidetes bacterium]|nr:MAG: T9SS type A sorting domain-containing protein [Bacteroidota bacterium]